MLEALTLVITFGIVLGFVYFMVWWSYQARADRSALVGLYIMLGTPGFLLLVAGVALTVDGRVNPWGLTLTMTAVGFLLPIWPKFRVWISRIGSFLPQDALHITGLGLFFALLGFLGSQNILLPAPDIIAEEIGIGAIIVQGLFFVGLALACVGYGIGRDAHQAKNRLDLRRISLVGVGAAVGVVLAGYVLAIVFNGLSIAFEPDTNRTIDENLDTLAGGQSAWIMAPVIGLTAGIGEELLFRGALQPRYGIILTSLLFTSLHSQYGLSFVLAGLFGLSILLGLVAKRFGTTHAIIAHTLYNTVAVALSSLG